MSAQRSDEQLDLAAVIVMLVMIPGVIALLSGSLAATVIAGFVSTPLVVAVTAMLVRAGEGVR